MTARFECGLYPCFDDSLLTTFAYEIFGQAEHIDVVMTPAHFGSEFVVAGCRANAGKLIGRDGHADSRRANQNASLDLATRNFTRYR